MDKDKKFLVWFAVIIILVAVILMLTKVGSEDKEFVPRDEFSSQQDYLDYMDEYNEAKKLDTYGGKTPEETLDMFIEALKAGDTDLASKYFVIDKQKQIREELAIGKENGVLELLVGDLEKEKSKHCYEYDNSCEFTTFDENDVSEFSFMLIFNKETKVWKIESL